MGNAMAASNYWDEVNFIFAVELGTAELQLSAIYTETYLPLLCWRGETVHVFAGYLALYCFRHMKRVPLKTIPLQRNGTVTPFCDEVSTGS